MFDCSNPDLAYKVGCIHLHELRTTAAEERLARQVNRARHPTQNGYKFRKGFYLAAISLMNLFKTTTP